MKQTDAGFTLIEILIALSIFVIIAMITSSVLFSVSEQNNDLQKQLGELKNQQILVANLQQDFNNIINQSVFDNNQQVQAAFVSAPQSLSFTTSLNNSANTGLTRIEYHWNSSSISRTATAIDDKLNPKGKPQTQTLMDKLSSVNISFLSLTGGFASNWPPANLGTAETQGTYPIPRAIKVILTFQNQERLELLFTIPTTNIPVLVLK